MTTNSKTATGWNHRRWAAVISETPDPNAVPAGASAEYAQRYRDYRYHSEMLGRISNVVAGFCQDSEDTTLDAVLELRRRYRWFVRWAWGVAILFSVLLLLGLSGCGYP